MNYKQFIDSQRHQIESYLKAGFSQTKIARILDVNKSTISRGLKRNSKKRSYHAQFAINISKELSREAYKHAVFDTKMKRYIGHKLKNYQWSPEQI